MNPTFLILVAALVHSILLLAAAGQDSTKASAPDLIAPKYQPELDRLKADYEARVRAILLRMMEDYESALKSATSSGNLEAANGFKAKIEALQDKLSKEMSIVGKWNIVHGAHVDVWTFNRDHTYNYGGDTGIWTFSNGTYTLKHTWDWALRLTDDHAFEGVCTRGEIGTKLSGTRSEP